MMAGRTGRWRSLAKEALEQSMIVAKTLCLIHVTGNYLCTPFLVYGPSMSPTLNLNGDVLLSEGVSPRLGWVAAGDVVMVRSPEDPTRIVTKRVLGLEGDRVAFLVDPEHSDWSRTVVVPKGHAWIQGDNIYESYDSRTYGPIPYGLIQKKAICRVWPLKDFGSLGR